MSNIEIEAAKVDGSVHPIFEAGKSCDQLAIAFVGDDTGAPVTLVRIKVQTASGKTVCVNIPNGSGEANVSVDGVQV